LDTQVRRNKLTIPYLLDNNGIWNGARTSGILELWVGFDSIGFVQTKGVSFFIPFSFLYLIYPATDGFYMGPAVLVLAGWLAFSPLMG
jgi:hypothetical protein